MNPCMIEIRLRTFLSESKQPVFIAEAAA